MNDKQIKNINNFLSAMEGGSVQPEELVQVVEAVLSVVKDLKEQTESKMAQNKGETGDSLESLSYDLKEKELRLEGLITKSKEFTLSEVRNIANQLNQDVNSLRLQIPAEVDFSDIYQKLTDLEKKIPILEKIDLNPIYEKIEELKKSIVPIDQRRLDDIERMAKENSMPVTTAFYNGLRAKNLTIVGATAVQRGDTVFLTTTGGGGHTIQDEGVPLTQRTNLNFVGAGVTVTDDSANDATKVTISTSAGAGYQQPTSGTVNGTNKVFGFAVAPNALVVDGVSMQKVAVDTTVNWTGTTSITLTVAPNFDVYGVA